jgi:hypothetical protein
MASAKPEADRSIADWVERLQAAGRDTFTREELADFAGRSSVAVDAAAGPGHRRPAEPPR